MKILRKERRNLPVKLTEEQVKVAGDDLAKTVQDIVSELLRQAKVKAELKVKMATLEELRDSLALRVVRKEEDRLVDVEIQIVDSGVGDAVVREVRLDTGALVGAPRPASDEEGQMSLMLDDVPNGGPV